MTADGLWDGIGFEPRLEKEALRRLGELDLDGCRRTLGRMVAALDLAGAAGRDTEVTSLLLDVLQQVNRRVHDGDCDDGDYLRERADLIAAFAACDGAAAARELFVARLNRLLARLGGDTGPAHTTVERARRYIDEHYDERVFLSAVATKLNVSPNYLSRLFREQVGVTLTHYVQQKRVERARMMLAAGNGTISEIAYRVGYQNYRDFYRNFVKLEGASPRAVQRRLAKNA